jgi:hypothetical protein
VSRCRATIDKAVARRPVVGSEGAGVRLLPAPDRAGAAIPFHGTPATLTPYSPA